MRTLYETLLVLVILVCVSNALYDFMSGEWLDGGFLVIILAIAVWLIARTKPTKSQTVSLSD